MYNNHTAKNVSIKVWSQKICCLWLNQVCLK